MTPAMAQVASDGLFTLAAAGAASQQAVSDTDLAHCGSLAERLAAARKREQEKNRRAQARFRERQKAKHTDTQRRMLELESAVKKLQLERDALAVKADTLERCLLTGSDIVKPEPLDRSATAAAAARPSALAAALPPPAPTQAAPALSEQPVMSFEAFAAWWTGRVQELAPLLVQAQFDSNSPAASRIAEIWHDMLATANSQVMRSVSLRTRVYSEPLVPSSDPPPAPPDKTLWKHLTESLQLTAPQRQQCRELRKAFLQEHTDILVERAALTASMQASMPDCNANPKVAVQHTKALQTMEQLQKSLVREQIMLTDIANDLYLQVLTPIQAAYAVVGLWPWIPDKLAIFSAICDAEEPISTGRA